jgi:hypothetical protein
MEVKMTSEVEFAMKYAKERKMRMALETRLYGVLDEVIPFMGVAVTLVDAIIGNNHDKASKCIKKITAWRVDLEVQVFINTFFPVGTWEGIREFIEATPLDDLNADEISEKGAEALKEICNPSGKQVLEEWDRLAQQYRLAPRNQVTRGYIEELEQKMKETLVQKSLDLKVEIPDKLKAFMES